MTEQKIVYVTEEFGQYHNFFFTPGSIGSLSNYIEDGWVVKFIKDGGNKACILLERESVDEDETDFEAYERMRSENEWK
jgi:esterase/lipase superfamily enzyme